MFVRNEMAEEQFTKKTAIRNGTKVNVELSDNTPAAEFKVISNDEFVMVLQNSTRPQDVLMLDALEIFNTAVDNKGMKLDIEAITLQSSGKKIEVDPHTPHYYTMTTSTKTVNKQVSVSVGDTFSGFIDDDYIILTAAYVACKYVVFNCVDTSTNVCFPVMLEHDTEIKNCDYNIELTTYRRGEILTIETMELSWKG